MLEVLKSAKLCYQATFNPQEVAVHPSNRGGSGLHPHNAHAVGASIYHVGAHISELEKATEFEKLPGNQGEQQLKFNEDIITQSGHLLSPLLGSERIMSVACGHTAAFCRAALHGCETPEESLRGRWQDQHERA